MLTACERCDGPRPSEKAVDFFRHYAKILEALPTTMLVASAPSFEGAPVLFDEGGAEGDPEEPLGEPADGVARTEE